MRKLFSDSFATTIAFFAQRSMAFVRELILARILGPYYLGLRNTIIMLYNYVPWVQFGSGSEMFRKVASLHEKNPSLSKQYFTTQFVFTIAVSVLLSALILLYTQFSNHSQEFTYGLYFLSVLVILRLVGPIISIYLQSIGEFKYVSAVEILVVFLNLILVISLAYMYGWLGALAGLCVPLLVRLLFHSRKISDVPIIFDFQKLIELLKGGFRLFVNSISNVLYTQIDSLITVAMLGPAALGIYGVATTINSLIYGTFGATIQPIGQRMLKAADNENVLLKYLNTLLSLSSYLMVLPIIVIILVSPFVIDNFIPSFHESIALINILAIASFFNLVSGRVANYLYAKRMENKITISTLISAGVNLVLNIYLIMQGFGIIGVAYATSVSYIVYFFIIFYLGGQFSIRKIALLLIPLLYLLIAIYSNNLILISISTLIYAILTYRRLKSDGILGYLLTNIFDVIGDRK